MGGETACVDCRNDDDRRICRQQFFWLSAGGSDAGYVCDPGDAVGNCTAFPAPMFCKRRHIGMSCSYTKLLYKLIFLLTTDCRYAILFKHVMNTCRK